QVHRALITTRLGRREAWLDQRPLRIGQVAWIAQVVAVIAGTIFGRPHRQRLPQNQAATLESQPIHPIQYLPGQTLRTFRTWRSLPPLRSGRACSALPTFSPLSPPRARAALGRPSRPADLPAPVGLWDLVGLDHTRRETPRMKQPQQRKTPRNLKERLTHMR